MKFFIYDYKNELRTDAIVRTGSFDKESVTHQVEIKSKSLSELEENTEQLIRIALRRISPTFKDIIYFVPEVEIIFTKEGAYHVATIKLRTYDNL